MDAIVLAGGLGTRLRDAVSHLPKSLAPIGGRPFLDYLLAYLSKFKSINRVILATGYMSEKVIESYSGRTDFGFRIDFSIEEELLGTGGGIKKALEHATSETVIAMNGDSFIDVDIEEFIGFHKNQGGRLSIVLKRVEDSGRYGFVKLEGERVLSFDEKRPDAGGGLINAGIYIFDRKIFDIVEPHKIYSIEKDLIPEFVKNHDVFGYVSSGRFIDIGLPETYEASEDFFGNG